MRRIYTDVSAFRAPYRSSNISFAGLGSPAGHAAYDQNRWAPGRAYYDISQYRMPYRSGYYQSGALRGTEASGTVKGLVFAGIVLATIAIGMYGDRLLKEES